MRWHGWILAVVIAPWIGGRADAKEHLWLPPEAGRIAVYRVNTRTASRVDRFGPPTEMAAVEYFTAITQRLNTGRGKRELCERATTGQTATDQTVRFADRTYPVTDQGRMCHHAPDQLDLPALLAPGKRWKTSGWLPIYHPEERAEHTWHSDFEVQGEVQMPSAKNGVTAAELVAKPELPLADIVVPAVAGLTAVKVSETQQIAATSNTATASAEGRIERDYFYVEGFGLVLMDERDHRLLEAPEPTRRIMTLHEVKPSDN